MIAAAMVCGVWTAVAVALQSPAATQVNSTSSPQAGSSSAARGERTTWYFYKVKWGHQDEFLDLFQRNHYPVLQAMQKAGGFSSVRTYVPRYHGDGRADWTFAVELVAPEPAPAGPTEAEIIKRLYPDQEKFRQEERRRFELLDAHWDVPLNPVDMDSRPLSSP